MKRKRTSQASALQGVAAFLMLVVYDPTQVLSVAAAAHTERVLRLARSNEPKTLDWARNNMAMDGALLPFLNRLLVDLIDGTALTNSAARSWSRSEDARVYTFHLRPELKFSNGRPVVAADYIYTSERILDPGTASPSSIYVVGIKGAKAFIAARLREQASRRGHDSQNGPDSERWIAPLHVSGLRAINDDTLIIELDQPDPVFPFMWPCIAQPREEVERSDVPFGLRGVGDGPYRVGEWIRGKRLVFEPNPHYSGQEPRHFDRIDIMIGGDASTHLMMFERGELDVAEIENFTLPIADHARIASNPKWRSCLEESLAGASVYVVLNTEVIPFNHLKVRQALNYAVNKPRCLHVSGGRWMVGAGILPPLIPGYNPKLQGYPYDPDKARALLAASDVPRPIRLSLWYPHEFECVMIAQRIQADLRGAGVEVELKEVTPAEMGMALSVRGKVPMALFGFITSVPDPKDLLVSLFDGRSLSNSYSYNFAFYANPKVDRLLDEAAAELRMPTRYALFQQAEEIIVRDAPFIFLGYPKFFALKQPWIKGRLIEPLWPFRLDRIWKE